MFILKWIGCILVAFAVLSVFALGIALATMALIWWISLSSIALKLVTLIGFFSVIAGTALFFD